MTASNGDPGIDLYDVTQRVERVTASSPLLPWPLEGYTNGKSFLFSAAQVEQIAAALPVGQVTKGPNGEWREVIAGKGIRILAERHIDGVTYYRFRKHWGFEATAG